jgi:excisionase family DNA binding protein
MNADPTTLSAILDLTTAVQALSHQLGRVSVSASSGPMNSPAAAKYLGMSEATLRKKVNARQIPCERVGRHMKFRQRDLDAYIEKQKRKWQ